MPFYVVSISSMQKTLNALLLTGFALCLLQIWWPSYYLTGDGPSHLYNAQVLHDVWNYSKSTDFYLHFYHIVYRPDPNWLSTIILALLLFVVKGAIAEKIFLTLYVVLFVRGFHLLLAKISGGSSYWALAIFLFVFPHELAKGFYNSSLSIAFYFWVVWSWLRLLEKKSVANAVLFFLFIALTYFTHLLAFGFAAFTCAALVISYVVAGSQAGIDRRGKFIAQYGGLLVVFLAPFLALMVLFTQQEGGLQLVLKCHFYRLVELAQLKFLANVTTKEFLFSTVAGVVLLLLFCFSLIKYRVKNQLSKYDGLLLTLLFAMFIYLCFPEAFMGRLILITMRVQPIVGALIVCCVAYSLPHTKIKNAGSIVLFACFGCLTVVRINCLSSASREVSDYISAEGHIRANSVVLPLDFAPSGIDEHGGVIADWNFLFAHASQYLGAAKPLVILDNYEANMGYFPVRWNDAVNPYTWLSKGEGIEGVPPYASIASYKQAAGVTIDYILMWSYNPSFLQNEHFRELYAEISAGYHVVYTSPSRRSVLWEVNEN